MLKRLAVGGMAELYLAKDTRHDRLVVIKRILPYLAQEAEFVQMFLDEARIAAQLHHPNIITVHELGSLEGSIFIAMEYVEGVDLRKVLQKEQAKSSAVPPNIAAWLTSKLSEGLHYAHNKVGSDGRPLGIIHRDVSPQNLMVGYGAQVKLVDFGIAKAGAFMERSKPGVIKGKFLYLSPEQLSQDRIDQRADIFALGTMLYEICVGKSPFYKPTTEAVIYAIRAEDPPPPHIAKGRFSERLSKIIMRCLLKDRSRRYQQAGEVHSELEAYLKAEAPTSAEDVRRYVATLFGNDEERTALFIPPNARGPDDRNTGSISQQAPRPREPQVEMTDPDRTARGVSVGGSADEPTKPLTKPSIEAEVTGTNSSSVGRRPTPAPNTMRAVGTKRQLATEEAETTAPIAAVRRTPQRERDAATRDREAMQMAPTAPTPLPVRRQAASGLKAAGSSDDLDPTSLSGSGRLMTGDSISALTPSGLGPPVDPEVTGSGITGSDDTGAGTPVTTEDARPPRKPAPRKDTAAVFEVPQKFARDEIPGTRKATPSRAAARASPGPRPSPPGPPTPSNASMRPLPAEPPTRSDRASKRPSQERARQSKDFAPMETRAQRPSNEDLGPLLDSAIPSRSYVPSGTFDEDDQASTQDLRGQLSQSLMDAEDDARGTYDRDPDFGPGPIARRPWLVMLLVFAAVLTVGLIGVGVMRWSQMPKTPPVTTQPKTETAPAGQDPAPNAGDAPPQAGLPTEIGPVTTVMVRFMAPSGTRIINGDGQSLAPNSGYQYKPGRHMVQYRCPKKGRVTPPDIMFSVEVKPGQSSQQFSLNCR